MPAQQQHWIRTAFLSGSTGPVAIGTALVSNGTAYVVATAANRALYGRATGIALDAGDDDDRAVEVQAAGSVDESITGLAEGDADDWVIVDANGALERKTSPVDGDDIIGRCPHTSGDMVLMPCASLGGGGGGGDASYPIDLTNASDVTVPAAGVVKSDGTVLSSEATLAKSRGGWGADISAQSGVPNFSTGTPTWITLATGIATWFATPSGANLAAALTSALPVTKGGTGATSFTSGRLLYGNGTSAINESGSNLSYNGTTLTANNIATGGIVWDGSLASGGSNCVSDNSGVHDWLVCRLASDLSSRGVISFDFDKVTFGSDYAGTARMPTTEVRGNEVRLFASSGGSTSGYIKLTSSGVFIQDAGGDHFMQFAIPNLAADRTLNFPLLAATDKVVCEAFAATLTNKTIAFGSNTITFTSAQLATACSDETGTAGNLVFSTNPSLTAPTMSNPVVTGTPQYTGTRVTKKTVIAEVQTSSTTQTTCGSYTMSNETLVAFEVHVTCARRTNVTKGGLYKRSVVYRRTSSGSPTIVGSLESGTDKETTAGDDVTIDTSSNDVRVRVTAADSDGRNWVTEMYVTEVTAA